MFSISVYKIEEYKLKGGLLYTSTSICIQLEIDNLNVVERYLWEKAPQNLIFTMYFLIEKKKTIQTQSSGISSVCNQDVTNQWENTVILHWRLPVQRYLSIYKYTITCKYTVQTMYCLCRASQQYNWCFGLYSLHTKHRDLCRIIKMTPGWSWPLRNTCLGADHSCDAEVWTGQ